jgi:hypothetical protein
MQKKMSLPGFLAEAALSKSNNSYSGGGVVGGNFELITPAQHAPRCYCWPGRDGNLNCICEGETAM